MKMNVFKSLTFIVLILAAIMFSTCATVGPNDIVFTQNIGVATKGGAVGAFHYIKPGNYTWRFLLASGNGDADNNLFEIGNGNVLFAKDKLLDRVYSIRVNMMGVNQTSGGIPKIFTFSITGAQPYPTQPLPQATVSPTQTPLPAIEPPVTENDFLISQNAQGGITITGYTGRARQVVIPETISGLRVTAIGERAFYNKNLTAITIPNGVTTIGNNAFGNINTDGRQIISNNFQFLTIPDSVISIGINAFAYCGIRYLTLGSELRTIWRGAFTGNEIGNLIIPDWVTRIEGGRDGAFQNCGIKTLTLGKGLTYIGENAFADNNLTELNLPDSIKEIHDGAFKNNQLTSLVIPNGVILISCNYDAMFGRYNAPFEGNPLNHITIPQSLASHIYRTRGFEGGFYNLPTITSITLPANVDEQNLRQFGGGFVNFWNLQGKRAGTYVYNGRIWTLQ